MEKNDFHTISCVNYRTLHVKQPDVASGVLPETKPPLREPNNYIKRAFPLFSSFSVVWLTQFFGIIKKTNKQNKKKRKKKLHSWTFLTLIISFNFKDEHYNSITRRLELVGARKNVARERDTRISSRARSLSRPTSKCLLLSYMSRCFQAPP